MDDAGTDRPMEAVGTVSTGPVLEIGAVFGPLEAAELLPKLDRSPVSKFGNNAKIWKSLIQNSKQGTQYWPTEST